MVGGRSREEEEKGEKQSQSFQTITGQLEQREHEPKLLTNIVNRERKAYLLTKSGLHCHKS